VTKFNIAQYRPSRSSQRDNLLDNTAESSPSNV
jgi:hypothetical protein